MPADPLPAQPTPGAPVTGVLAEVVRSGFVEGTHSGSLVALAADGSTAWSVGEPSARDLPQVLQQADAGSRHGALRAGPRRELLALASASHSGEDFHLDGVRRILRVAGLDEAALQTPADLPVGEAERLSWLRSGRAPAPLAMNCSGKHAAMLVTCVSNGWPTESYRDPAHPLQQALLATLEELAGEPVAATGVDGCGAPLFAISLLGLARAVRAVAVADPATAEGRVAAAIRAAPRSWAAPAAT
jgi:L-asparaginase II